MSWRGDGYMVLIVDGTSYSYPYELLGSRREEWAEEVAEVVTRRSGARVWLERELRFEAEYTWPSNLSTTQITQLINWSDAWPKKSITVRPRHDVTVLQVACYLEELEIIPGVKGAKDTVRALFRAINTTQSIPIPNQSKTATSICAVGVVGA